MSHRKSGRHIKFMRWKMRGRILKWFPMEQFSHWHSQKVPDFLYFESRKSTMEQIINALSDVHVHRIGVHGMGGIGKTMLVKEILRKIVENKSFDEVVILTISQTPDIEVIQEELADILGLKFEQKSKKGRALKLQKRLKMEKSILVVLDDVWEPIDLETIGIPSVEDHIGCKLLFTTRERYLISTEMCVDKIFEIKTLGEDESWNLFKAMTGEIVETCDRKPIAIQIVRECAGLPITITVVAKALKEKCFDHWIEALHQLRKGDVVVNIRGMNKKVYSSLKLSYDYLECEEARLLFLLCSMFREDRDIDVNELQVYAMGLGFLQGVDTMAQGRRRITNLVDDLISSSLLLQSELGNNYVKMHDMVRDISISIASKHENIRTLSCVKRWDDELVEKLSGNHTVVSLIIEDLHDSLPKLMLPNVQLFTFHGVSLNDYVSVVETFFEEMKELKGLELKGVEISLLPPSLYSLANIRLLRLQNCKFGNIDMIGELKKVEILDFCGSNITQLPTTICQLTQLKVLNLNYCGQLKVIPPNILSKLTKLEELKLNIFYRWEGEEWYEGRKNASLFELKYLPHLCVLDLTIQDEEIVPKHLFSEELDFEKLHISIGCKRKYDYYNLLRKLDLKIESGSCLNDWIKTLLKRSEAVHLEGSICSKTLQLELLDANEFLHLKHLSLYDNLEVQHLIQEKNKPLRKCISKLEWLRLEKLENLESITHGYDGESAFNKLRDVIVFNCNKLETLFFNCNMDVVLNLEEIEIRDCMKMEVMISVMEDEEATKHVKFTHLKFLTLSEVPRLLKFCSKKEKCKELSGDNSERSTIKNDIGDSFFTNEVSLPNLEQLEITGAHNLKMIWSNALIPNSFSKLKEVKISSCNNLEKVFPPNMMSLLICLNILTIISCPKIEMLMENEEASNRIEFTHLKSLTLNGVPRLQKFCSKKEKYRELSGDNSERSRIKNGIGDSFFMEEVSLPNLEKLKIRSTDNSKMIWSNVLIPSSFSKLKEVEISSCNNLEKVFPPYMMSLLICLNILRIKGCKLLEGIFEVQEPISVTETASLILFQNLRELTLYDLPNLEYVWNKNPCEFQIFVNMETLSIKKCSKLRREPSDKSFKQLEELSIDMKQLMKFIEEKKTTTDDMMESKQLETSKVEATQLQGDFELFPMLKTLKLYGFLDYTSTHLPMKIVQILYQLEVFYLEGAFIEEIIPIDTLIQLKTLGALILSKLPKLKHLWNECLQKNTLVLQGLWCLSISECGALSSLVPSLVSFTNLCHLKMHRCHSLTHLLNTSVVRTLMNLSYLTLKECKRMTTVIEGEAKEGNDEIVLSKLCYLHLSSSSKLTSFYSGRGIIKLPCLNSASIYECPEMKVFSFGIVSTPNLKLGDVDFGEDNIYYCSKDSKKMMVEDINVIVRENWENNVDTRIPYLFGEETLEENQCEH